MVSDSGLSPDSFGQHNASNNIYPPHGLFHVQYSVACKFFGREQELAQLDAWLKSEDTTLIVEAVGGEGKSTLIWHWLTSRTDADVIKRGGSELSSVIWWSFYEDGDSQSPALGESKKDLMDDFICGALQHVTGRDVLTIERIPAHQRLIDLLAELNKQPYLLVLDGIELLMPCHQRSKKEGDEAAAQYHQRCCFNPRHGSILGQLVQCAPSKFLISTRLRPHDLENPHTNRLIPGVAHMKLKGLAPKDGLAMIRHLGVRGSDRQLHNFMAQFGYHGLLLNVLAGQILDYHSAPGDFEKWYADLGKQLRLSDLKINQRNAHILDYALDQLDDDAYKLLKQVAACRYPADYETLADLNPYLPPRPKNKESLARLAAYRKHLADLEITLGKARTKAGRRHWRQQIEIVKDYIAREERLGSEWAAHDNSPAMYQAKQRFGGLFSELENRGLLQWDRANNNYDLHPVIRKIVLERFDDDDRAVIYDQIRVCFQNQLKKVPDQVSQVAQLRPVLEVYHAHVGAGQLDEAATFYGERLSWLLHNTLGAYWLIIELLDPLFQDGMTLPPTLADKMRQGLIMADLIAAFCQTGQIDQALRLGEQALTLNLNERNAAGLGMSLRNYANALRLDGQLAAAQQAGALARDLAAAARNGAGQALANLYLLRLYVDTGQWADAEKAHKAFWENPPGTHTAYWQAEAERRRMEMQIAKGKVSKIDQDLERAGQYSSQGVGWCEMYMLFGEVALLRGKPADAAAFFQDALTAARRYDMPLGRYLGRLACVQGQPVQVRQSITKALIQMADAADIALVLAAAAETYLRLGDKAQAEVYARHAYRHAWADGLPHVWRGPLDRAAAVLDMLKKPKPKVLAYSRARVSPIPHEDEIRAFIARLVDKNRRQ